MFTFIGGLSRADKAITIESPDWIQKEIEKENCGTHSQTKLKQRNKKHLPKPTKRIKPNTDLHAGLYFERQQEEAGPEYLKPWKSIFHNTDYNLTEPLPLVKSHPVTYNLSDNFYCNVCWQPELFAGKKIE